MFELLMISTCFKRVHRLLLRNIPWRQRVYCIATHFGKQISVL